MIIIRNKNSDDIRRFQLHKLQDIYCTRHPSQRRRVRITTPSVAGLAQVKTHARAQQSFRSTYSYKVNHGIVEALHFPAQKVEPLRVSRYVYIVISIGELDDTVHCLTNHQHCDRPYYQERTYNQFQGKCSHNAAQRVAARCVAALVKLITSCN